MGTKELRVFWRQPGGECTQYASKTKCGEPDSPDARIWMDRFPEVNSTPYDYNGVSVGGSWAQRNRDKLEDHRWQRWQGWAWLLSVAMTSALLTVVIDFIRTGVTSNIDGRQSIEMDRGSTFPAPQVTISKRATCNLGGSDHGNYNMPLRVGAVFIILVVSTAACAFPILAAKSPGLRMPAGFFFSVRHFGTGVLIATAFVHLLPTAFILLGDPCLSSFWTEDYPAMPGAIALAGIFIVTIIEMLLHPARGTPKDDKDRIWGSVPRVINPKRVLRGRTESIGRNLAHMARDAEDQDRIENNGRSECELGNRSGQETSAERRGYNVNNLTPEQQHKKEVMHCILLEIGILFHSVFIGMALSVAIGGSEFVVLLIAIIFHQTFEGLALGSRISAITWPEKSWRPIFMALAYGCTTPIGQAIGLAARSAYSPDSEVGLVLVGVMNAISAGLLVFASLVELLSEDLLSDESWRLLRGRRRVCAFLLVVAGAFGMSLVGAWA